MDFSKEVYSECDSKALSLDPDTYALIDMGKNHVGLFSFELEVKEAVYVNAGGDAAKEGVVNGKSITVFPLFEQPYNVPIEEKKGGHGGGDTVLLNDLFGVPEYDPYKRAAGYIDGAMSILTGIAANKSIASGMPVDVMSMVDLPGYRKI